MYFICTLKFYWQKMLKRGFIFLSHCKEQLTTHGEFGKTSYLHSILFIGSIFAYKGSLCFCRLCQHLWVIPPPVAIVFLWHQTSFPHAKRFMMHMHLVVRYLAILSVQDMVMSCSPSSTPSHVCAALWHRTGMVPSPDSIFVRRCPRYFLTMCLLLFTAQNEAKNGNS